MEHLHERPVMLHLDDHVVLTPSDLAQCDYALVRQVAEHRGYVETILKRPFLAKRRRALEKTQRAGVVASYRRTYSQFSELAPASLDSLSAIRSAHARTATELRSLRAVAGGTLLLELSPHVLLAASPAVALPGTVADTLLERFARAGDLAALGAHAHALHAATGQEVTYAHLHLNNDRRIRHSGPDLVAATLPRLGHLTALASRAAGAEHLLSWTDPEVVACGFCAWCKAAAREQRDVHMVWGVRRPLQQALHASGVRTIEDLAESPEPPEGFDALTWSMFHDRARLQLEQEQSGQPAFHLHNPGAIEALPAPDPGDIFFDFEGDPLWVEKNRYEWGLEFLFGYTDASGHYTPLWATSQAEEGRVFARFVDFLLARRQEHPGMHVYHYAFYEPAALRRLARRHGTRQKEVNSLLEAGLFVDLYNTVKAGLHSGSSSYGLKALEPLYMGADLRTGDVGDGADAVLAFQRGITAQRRGKHEEWEAIKADLADYNHYDCRSTHRLRDWLLTLTPAPDPAFAAMGLLGATPLEAEPQIAPLTEVSEMLDPVLQTPGFEEVGVFHIFAGNSTDALGSSPVRHEFLGRISDGTALFPGQEVLVVYSDPSTSLTDTRNLRPRRAVVEQCELVGNSHRLILRETTPVRDPLALSPAYVLTQVPPADPRAVLRAAKRVSYTLITGPVGAESRATAHQLAEESGAPIITAGHATSIPAALEHIGAADRAIILGDPALAAPPPARALPEDLVRGSILSWLLGESGAKIAKHRHLPTTTRFFPELGHDIEKYVYDGEAVVAPPSTRVRLLAPEHTGLGIVRVAHHGNRGTSIEEAREVRDLVARVLDAGPLEAGDILVTAAYDPQVLLLDRELSEFAGVRVLRAGQVARATADAPAALSILSLGVSTLADLPRDGVSPLARHLIAASLTAAREGAYLVCSTHLLAQLPARAQGLAEVTEYARLLG